MTVLDEGRIIGGLRIGRLLGHGAMGEVYRAEQLVLHRPVAVKRILPQFAGSAPAIERLAREARALASVRSPYVVQVHDLVRAEGEVLLVMELVEGGGALRPWCGHLPWQAATCLVRHLADALAAAHAAGVIHRDVKPDNALLAADGTARLGDFGLARALDSAQLTAAGAVLGTPAYLAPECRSGQPGAEPADVYSLGCTWFHLLAGHPPFRGSDVSDLLRRHAEEPPPDVHALVADLQPAVGELLRACLAKDPVRRPTAAALAERIRAIPGIPDRVDPLPAAPRGGALAPTLTPDTAPTTRAALPATPADPAPAPPASARPRWRRLLPWAALAAVAIVVAMYLPGMIPSPREGFAAVRRLAEIGQITEARAGITRIVEGNPEAPVQELVRDVDLAEARHLWRIGRRPQALTCYGELVGRHRGDRLAAGAVVEDLPEFEPVVLDALLALPELDSPKKLTAAWRWLPVGNRSADWYPRLLGLLAANPAVEAQARERLRDKDDGMRNAAIDVLEKSGRAGDADRISYHVSNLIMLRSWYDAAQASRAWLEGECAKPGWDGRKAAAGLPAFIDVAALHDDDERVDPIERLLVRAFAAEVRPHLAAWRSSEEPTLAARAARMAQALPPP